MALKNVKTARSGSRGKGRHVTRTEAKDGARRLRREEDKAHTSTLLVGCATCWETAYPCSLVKGSCRSCQAQLRETAQKG